MEPLKFSLLNPYSKRSKIQTYFAYVLGIAYLLIPAYKLLHDDFSFYTALWLILAVIILFSGIFYSKIAETYFILIDDEKISSKDSVFNKFIIAWTDIEHLEMKPISIRIFKKNGQEKTVHLHNMEFNNVKLIKEELTKIAELKKISIK